MLKVVWNIIKRILSIFGVILSPLKRLVCRRKRKNSDTLLPLANHYPSVENLSSNGVNQMQEELGSWDTWEDESSRIRTVEQYRQHQLELQRQVSQEDEPEPDYFSDMIPKVKRQKKLFIKKNEDNINPQSISSKLAPMDMPLGLQTSELESWDDSHNAWEADAEVDTDLSWEADNVIREKRRQERQQRQLEQQRKKYEREMKHKQGQHGHLNAVRLS